MTAALNGFISRSADMCCPFFQLFHKWKDFQWTEEYVTAFEDLKQYLSNPPILSRSDKEEVLYAYLAVTNHIAHVTRKLPHYFQAHTIVVLTQLPLQALLRKSDYTGKIAKWGTKLRAYDVKYMPWTAIKGQVLADFVAEFVEGVPEEENAIMGGVVSSATIAPSWKVYMDGASNQKGAGVGIVLVTLEKLIMEKSLRLGFSATNNEVEYEALLVGIAMVSLLGGEIVELYLDSRLIVSQVNGEFEAQDERM